MYVDGTNHPIGVDETAMVPRHSRREPPVAIPLDGLYLPETSHPAHILRDSFERQRAEVAAAAEAATYERPESVGELATIKGIFSTLREQLGPDLVDEIERLERAAHEAGGVPSLEHHGDNPAYKSLVEAYERASAGAESAAGGDERHLLDTTG